MVPETTVFGETGHSAPEFPMAQLDPFLPFKIAPMNGRCCAAPLSITSCAR
jgi:hypothetical protein